MRYLKLLSISFILLFLIACDSCKSSSGPGNNEHITNGWEYFVEARYSLAVKSFDEALLEQPSNVEAKVGKGWSLLMKDTSRTEQIINLLEEGIYSQDWKPDSRCALASARLIRKEYNKCIENSDSLLASHPDYVFQYKTNIDWRDVAIIKAQAQFLTQKYTRAWSTISQISELNLDPANSDSWVINGNKYPSFAAALSAELAKLSREYKSF